MSAGGAASPKASFSRNITPASAGCSILIALVELLQRWLEAAEFIPSSVPRMVPATALGLLLAALALLSVRPVCGRSFRLAGRVAAAATMAFGLAFLARYVGIWGEVGQAVEERRWWAEWPSFSSCLTLAFIGAALLGLGLPNRRTPRSAQIAAALGLVVALTGLVGHGFGSRGFYGLSSPGGMAVSSALAFVALALGALFADPDRGIAAIALSPSAGGFLLRRLMPVALLAPPLLGWLTLQGQARGLFDAAYGTALLDASLIVLLMGLIAHQAKALHLLDVERERLLAQERQAHRNVANTLESITDAFYRVDRDWRFTYLNSEAERLLRRPREQLLGRVVWEEFPAAVGAAFEREYHRAMREQTAVAFEACYPPLDRWFEVRAYPASDGLSVYFHDISERRRIEENLRDSEARFRLLADMIPQHIWTTDAEGHHNYFSRRWYEYTGTPVGQTEGEGWMELLHPDDRERVVARWQYSLRTGEPYVVEYRFRRADGAYCWFMGQAMPLRNESGDIVKWFGTLTDISENKRNEEERERLLSKEQEARAEAERRREELERVTESRARLIRGFSHDVRNSLGTADIQALLLEDGRALGALTPRQKEGVQIIRRSVSAAVRLIDDLQELARAEAGQIEIRRGLTDVSQVLRDVVEDFRAQANAAGLSLELDMPDALCTQTDPVRLRQILTNLVSNAVKYTLRGQVQIDVQQHAALPDRPGMWIAVNVTDTGPGIPRDKWEFIFHEYSRLNPHGSPGAGIGLAISRRLARLLEGDISVTSELGRGSTFTLWLPASSGGEDGAAGSAGPASP